MYKYDLITVHFIKIKKHLKIFISSIHHYHSQEKKMKFLLAAVFMLLAQLTLAQDLNSKRTVCRYVKESLLLSCKGPTGTVECLASWMFPVDVKIVGLGSSIDNPAEKFSLFPLKSDNTVWTDTKQALNGQNFVLSLYQLDRIEDNGVRVKDAACFNKLTALFKSSASNLPITLENKKQVKLFGDIFFFEKEVVKQVVNRNIV